MFCKPLNQSHSENPESYSVLGTMSGTSCDGLDMVFAVFSKPHDKWQFHIEHACTLPYGDEWKNELRSADNLPAPALMELDMRLGHFMGREIQHFIVSHSLNPHFIASHGHTVFHRPPLYTTQIGNGCAIHAETLIPVVCDFRSLDVALGGQGAPLVPIGDRLLFHDFPICLNIGGFSNLSFDDVHQKRIAFDVGAANIILNRYAELLGAPYDDGGNFARSGNLCEDLLQELNSLPYYSMPHPKTLGKEWVEATLTPLLLSYHLSPVDILRTYTEHIAFQIAQSIKNLPPCKVLVTGGGAYNTFLVERLTSLSQHSIIVPDDHIISFKEALIFAFLGILRIRHEVNCLSSVTGAHRDSCSGNLIGLFSSPCFME